MAITKTMKAVRDFLDTDNELRISKSKRRDLWQANRFVGDLISENYKKIWTDEGMVCQARDKDTGNVKNMTFVYNASIDCPDYDFVEFAFDFGESSLDKGARSYVNAMNQVIEKIIFGQKDIGPFAPKGYDLDYDKEHLKEGEVLSSEETYWNYDVEFILGDFVLFKDSKKNYPMEATMRELSNNSGVKYDERKPLNKYVVMLPVAINYIKVQRENKVIDVNYEEVKVVEDGQE